MAAKRPRRSTATLALLHLCLLVFSPPTSLAEAEPSRSQCLARPCAYRGECRGRSGACGATAAHCNGASIWLPGCGGESAVDRPTSGVRGQGASSLAPGPGDGPAMMEQPPRPQMHPQQQPQSQQQQQPFQQLGGFAGPPTISPTTAWHRWTNNQKADEEDEIGDWMAEEEEVSEGGRKGVPGYATGNEGNSNYTYSNETVWEDPGFNPNGWVDRPPKEDEEEGILDKVKFWENAATARGSTAGSMLVLAAAVLVAFSA